MEDPSASEDFNFQIRVVPSVVCLPAHSSLLVSLATNQQTLAFFPRLFLMLVLKLRRSCRWPLARPSVRNVSRRCLRIHLKGVVLARRVLFLHQPLRSGRSVGVWRVVETPVHQSLRSGLSIGIWPVLEIPVLG